MESKAKRIGVMRQQKQSELNVINQLLTELQKSYERFREINKGFTERVGGGSYN